MNSAPLSSLFPHLSSLFAPALTVGIVAGYAAALWWWLRRESAPVLLGLLSLCTAAVALRLVYTTEYPPGLTADEPKILACAAELLRAGRLATEGCTGLPVLLNALFQAQLVPLFGAGRWAIRSYSLVTGVLAVPAAFAVARALSLSAASSGAVAAFIAVLPWSLFFGRVSIGGELIFHQLLLVGALARLVWAEDPGGRLGAPAKEGVSAADEWFAVGVGGLGLCLLLYDYFCGRVMLGLPLVAALLARGRRRWLCIGVLVVALIGWVPHLRYSPPNAFSGVPARLHAELFTQPLQVLSVKAGATVRALFEPVGEDWTLTIRSAAMHPPLVLALALAGVLVGRRRGLFLAAGFAGGVLPAVVSSGASASAHRMLMALPFIALAAGVALDAVPRRRWRPLVVCAVVALVGVQSVRLFFAPAFWPPESRATFDAGATAVIESLPPPPRPPLIYAQQAEDFLAVQRLIDPGSQVLTASNWLPYGSSGIYVFAHPDTAALRAFYDALFGAERVRIFGGAFFVELKAGDARVLSQHGWLYQARCGTDARSIRVPTLYHAHFDLGGAPCRGPTTNIWRGRWEGRATDLVLRFSGAARVQTSAGISVDAEGVEARLSFPVTPGTDVTVTVVHGPAEDARAWWMHLLAQLLEVTPAGERIPLWESVRPLAVGQPAVAGAVS